MRHVVLDEKSDCFVRDTDSCLDDSSLEPRDKKSRVRVRRTRVG